MRPGCLCGRTVPGPNPDNTAACQHSGDEGSAGDHGHQSARLAVRSRNRLRRRLARPRGDDAGTVLPLNTSTVLPQYGPASKSTPARPTVPQTAVIPVVTRRQDSGLLNFAAHSPGDCQRDRKCRSVRLQRTGWKGLIQYITAGRRAFSRIVPVTQRHTVDRHHLEANRAVGSFHTGLAARRGRTLADMTIQRMDNVAIVVDDLDAAVAFFTELGMELEGKGQIEGLWADRTVGLNGVRSEIAMLRTRTATASWS